MKKVFLYIYAIALVVSCSKGLDREIVAPVNFRVFVAGGNSHSTKMDVPDTPGSQPGIEALNENLIKTLDVFFYPHDASNTTAAIYHRFFTPEESSGVWETSLDTDNATLITIFGNPLVNGAEAQVFAVANYYSVTGSGSETTLVSRFSGNESIQTIRTTKLSADFCKVDANLEGIKETSFVMEGTSSVTLSQRVGYYFIEGEIPLYRSAAKIELAANIPASVVSTGVEDANGNTWKPLSDQMDVILVNGCNKGIISTVIEEYAYDYPAGDEPINFPTGADQAAWWTTYGHRLTKEDGASFYEHSVPFYSYPTKDWKSNKMQEAYLVLLVPWQEQVDPFRVVPTYYQIPIAQNWAEEEYRIKSYRYYRMEVDVSIMGSFTPDNKDLVTLTNNSYIVLDWRQNTEYWEESTFSNVTMSEVSYLAMEGTEVYLDNEASGGIGYASSHPCTAVFTRMEFLSFLDNNLGNSATDSDRIRKVVYERQKSGGAWSNTWYRYVYDIEAPNTRLTGSGQSVTNSNAGDPFTTSSDYGGFPLGGYSLSTADDKITLTHTIPESQFTEATITVEVSNSAVPEPEVVTFVQRPPIYIEGHRSNGWVGVNTRHGTGSTYAYNDRGTNNRNYCIGTAGNTAAGTRAGNENRNLYSINISSFSDDKYVLGDPRTATASPVQYLSAPANYRPTRTSDTEKMIAPRFLIASSYGKSAYNNTSVRMTKDLATQRCAAYQEDGYPAGRWRVPTYAEVEFIMSLSTQGKIPSLFNMGQNDNVGYWCANGKVQSSNYVPFLGNNTDYTAVRCVYDLWYWGDDPVEDNATRWLGYYD